MAHIRALLPWCAVLQPARNAAGRVLAPAALPLRRPFSSANKFVDRAVVETYGGSGTNVQCHLFARDRCAQAAADA